MEMHDRIKELRKKDLKMSQEAFADRLGVTRDVIGNIELNRLARPDQKLSLIKLMCREFNVNENWILEGLAPKFIEPGTFSLDEYTKAKGLTERDRIIIREFMALEPSAKDAVYNMLEKIFLSEEWHGNKPMDYYNEISKDPEEFEI
ncbi:helix-turn-helix transcriptional regulator [Lacrimispora sphenoides]|uniref:DNA-binding transcriptional regulator, XRE-family HTH domain n=1 Tax=Lacrimispora sphenoides JCM 1415 TaxID=1297793 RepID=A0ABY1C5S8_9FIRM|nr:helix-turn-helix transcriptional regulator [Lacrimispora sphenoides]SET71310.1 DNA-binding transcriptional regulator, XRE-family HTH domain [[Clostridium] sphenoides JCM 1415]SUY50689.1 transcriptional regulator [Lacrimispora sphenoides]